MSSDLQPSHLSVQTAEDVDAMSYAPHRGLSRRALRLATTYINDHLGDPVRLQDLAQAAGISRFHFARLFRISTGESPMEYLLRARIERAQSILLTTERRMSDVATSLGFCDQSHFSRSFRRYVGMTPRQFAVNAGVPTSVAVAFEALQAQV